MWCVTEAECAAWTHAAGLTFEAEGQRIAPAKAHDLVVPLSNISWSRLAWFSRFLATAIEPIDECLFWVTLTSVWPSSEQWHLYCRLRESYGERRRIDDAPGHVFLGHETADLATFIGIALASGWDFHLLGSPNYVSAFISHDGFAHLYTDDLKAADALKEMLADAKLESRYTLAT